MLGNKKLNSKFNNLFILELWDTLGDFLFQSKLLYKKVTKL